MPPYFVSIHGIKIFKSVTTLLVTAENLVVLVFFFLMFDHGLMVPTAAFAYVAQPIDIKEAAMFFVCNMLTLLSHSSFFPHLWTNRLDDINEFEDNFRTIETASLKLIETSKATVNNKTWAIQTLRAHQKELMSSKLKKFSFQGQIKDCNRGHLEFALNFFFFFFFKASR